MRYGITEDGQLVRDDSQGNLPPGIKAVEGFAYTTAPEGYDYWYTATVATGITSSQAGVSGTFRCVAFTDSMRFFAFQKPRYGSGLFVVIDKPEAWGLPSFESAVEGAGGE